MLTLIFTRLYILQGQAPFRGVKHLLTRGQKEKRQPTKKEDRHTKRKKDRQTNKGQTVERDHRRIIFASLYITIKKMGDIFLSGQKSYFGHIFHLRP